MAKDVSEAIQPVMDYYVRWSKESFDMISKGMAMYGNISSAWMKAAEGHAGEKTEDPLKKWGEAFSKAYNELFEMYTQPLKMLGTGTGSSLPGKEAWESAFAGWKKMFAGVPERGTPLAADDDFMKFSKGWFDGYSRICQSWLNSMQKMGEVCSSALKEGEKPESAMNACTEMSDRFLSEWSTFVTEQGKAFLSLWKSSLPKEKEEPKKAKKE